MKARIRKRKVGEVRQMGRESENNGKLLGTFVV